MQNFMRNLMVHLARFFYLGKKSFEQKLRGKYFAQNQFFTDMCWNTKMAVTLCRVLA